ncbi:FAD-dependent monooxygenase [Microbispora sp. RL4-1S]|uniref:FAD-dependent monooxygenase n=1 Tax=Microbispora oryzae TaxID=2806554 RepID=A0A940WHS2_9ACTN|nr:FAD-dependent monooxygenase [Microbispora oryzae]MBP2702978.1 FAD-dependent monooxygenase [Microbispora oryzae]
MRPTRRGRILVAGGGLTGLALGIALRHRGFAPVVLERSAGPDRAGGGLVLAPNALKALAAIAPGLAGRVRAAGHAAGERGAAPHRSVFLDERGRVLGSVSFDGYEDRWGMPAVTLLRSDLHALLWDAAEDAGVEIARGFAADRYADDGAHVDLVSRTGEVRRGDVLVGADGANSAVRAQLLGDGPPRYRGFSAVRGVGPAPGAYRDGFIAYGRGVVLFAAAIGGGDLYWVASMTAPRGDLPRRPVEEALAEVIERTRAWHPDLRKVPASADPARCAVHDVCDRPPPRTWHRGRVALAGDAAHPMVYTLGQGAGMALEDASVLAAALDATGAAEVERRLRGYAAERGPRVRPVVRMSRMLGQIAHVRSPLTAAVRDAVLRATTRGTDGGGQNAGLFGWTPPAPPGAEPA